MIMPGKKIIFSKNLELACFHWNGKGLRPSTLQLSCDHPTPASPTLYPPTPVKTHKSLLVMFSNATWGHLGCQPYDWGGGKKRAQLLKPRVPRCNFIESQITMNGFNCNTIVAVNLTHLPPQGAQTIYQCCLISILIPRPLPHHRQKQWARKVSKWPVENQESKTRHLESSQAFVQTSHWSWESLIKSAGACSHVHLRRQNHWAPRSGEASIDAEPAIAAATWEQSPGHHGDSAPTEADGSINSGGCWRFPGGTWLFLPKEGTAWPGPAVWCSVV